MVTPSQEAQKIALYQEKLKITQAEAEELLAYDLNIDKGGKGGELSAEGEKVAKAMRTTARGPTQKKTVRERKADNEKKELMDLIVGRLDNHCESLTVNNPEREIEIIYKGRKFKVTLTATRAKKS